MKKYNDIIHYLGIDDNKKIFNEIKKELKEVLKFSKKNNCEYCLIEDFESGYFKGFVMLKKFKNLCCIKED